MIRKYNLVCITCKHLVSAYISLTPDMALSIAKRLVTNNGSDRLCKRIQRRISASTASSCFLIKLPFHCSPVLSHLLLFFLLYFYTIVNNNCRQCHASVVFGKEIHDSFPR